MLDLVVSQGRVVLSDGIVGSVDVGIADGRVAVITAAGTLSGAARTIDARGHYVLPGLIDPHTHPGNWRPFEDDIRSTGRSAAAGGITTLFATVKSARLGGPFSEDALPADVGSFIETFAGVPEMIERSSPVDIGLSFMIMTDAQAEEVERYASDLGVRSFKLHPSTSLGPWHRRIGFPIAADDGTVFLAVEGIARSRSLAMVHAENGQLARPLKHRLERSQHNDLVAWAEGTPDFGEAAEIEFVAHLCRVVDCPLYVAHVSSKRAIDAIREARALGTEIIAETGPQWLLHTAEEDPENLLLKYLPPVRHAEDRDALWEAVASGEIQCLGSDHVPNWLGAKRGKGFWSAVVGGAGTETMLSVLMHEGVHRRGIPITRVAELMSTGPARAFGVYPRKGCLSPGADGDLTIVDPDLERVVRISELESRGETDWSPLEGRTLRGWPVATIRRGELIARDGATITERGGTYLSRSAAANVGHHV